MTTQTVQETETAASGGYTDRFITLNGSRHHYQDWGNPEAPPLLMVHGLTQHSHSFDTVARQLRGRNHCIALDVRGRGESDWAPRESYGYNTYARDVAALLEALEIPAAHYLGTSMGGLIAMTLSIQAPEKILSLAMNDIGPHLGRAGLWSGISGAPGRINTPYSFAPPLIFNVGSIAPPCKTVAEKGSGS